jgi:hypothetical protein
MFVGPNLGQASLLVLQRTDEFLLTAGVVMPDGTKIAVTEGTPQGGPLSHGGSHIKV